MNDRGPTGAGEGANDRGAKGAGLGPNDDRGATGAGDPENRGDAGIDGEIGRGTSDGRGDGMLGSGRDPANDGATRRDASAGVGPGRVKPLVGAGWVSAGFRLNCDSRTPG